MNIGDTRSSKTIRSLGTQRSPDIANPLGHYSETSSRSIVAERVQVFNTFIQNNNNSNSRRENRKLTKHEFELYVKVCNPVVNQYNSINNNQQFNKGFNDELSSLSKETRLAATSKIENAVQKRVRTSVNFVLRPASSESRTPIDIISKVSNLNYAEASIKPRAFESRLRISIGSVNADSAASSAMKGQQRPPQLDSDPPAQSGQQQPPDTEKRERLIREQLRRKDRLEVELKAERRKLQSVLKDLEALTKPPDPELSYEDVKKKLRSEIYQLQVECDRLTAEVDRRLDPRVPLGETNVEFYKEIYTGQPLQASASSSGVAPPLPNRPPACELANERVNFPSDDKDGASWICRMCTFKNHPLMDQCEQCDMRKFTSHNTGTASAIIDNPTTHM